MHSFGFTVEVLEKQDSHEKLAQTNSEKKKNHMNGIKNKMYNNKVLSVVNRSKSQHSNKILGKVEIFWKRN